MTVSLSRSSFHPRFDRRLLAAAAATIAAAAGAPTGSLAQTAAPASAPAGAPQTVVVTGNPLASNELATPASVLSGERLLLRRGSSLGDTLDGLPGVSASHFGPNASRPIIRGQDGDRIRILSNAGASLDASSLSFDHAVPIDPLVVERIEVLRGPAALLYGGSAVGGVVNAIDNRIPRNALAGTSGAAEVRFGGAAAERGASALVETGFSGTSGFALHADAFRRKTDDLRVPAFDRPLDDGTTERRKRVADSASDAKGGAVGGSAVWDHGYLGAAVDTYRNDYGAVAEEGVVIKMKRDKLSLAGEVRDLGGFIATVRGQASRTDYRHQEVEGSGEVGTTFRNEGDDYRAEAVHRKLALGSGQLEGVFGVQGESATFRALGEEGFVPTTRTRQNAAFVLEQWQASPALLLSAGVRIERVSVDSAGDAADTAEPRFGGPQQRSFSPRNGSIGAVYNLNADWQLTASAAATERAPVSYELYANGIHAATGSVERGSLDQTKERSRNLDAGVQWRSGHSHAKLGAFGSRFGNYIALLATGEPDVVDDGERYPVYAFRGVRARFYGMEFEGQTRLLDGASPLDIDGRADWVRADNLSTGEPLPRIAPVRLTAGLAWQHAGWSLRAEVQHAARQRRVPADDSATPGWTMVNLSASYKLRVAATDAVLFAKLNNAGNQLAYNAATIATVRQLAPLAGRALQAGVRVAF